MTAPIPSTRQVRVSPRAVLLCYTGSLAFIAGFVNAVALLILAFPVGNLTGVTTQLGMNTANPLLYEGHLLVAILIGFWAGALAAGTVLGSSEHPTGQHHAVVLALEGMLLLLAAVGVAKAEVHGFVATLGIEPPVLQAMFAAAALGMQNGLTSSLREMAIRTTHFTGTVTDLGLMLGRSRQHGLDKWKLAVLAATLLLFLVGGATGLLFGNWLGGYALLAPASACVALAVAYAIRSRRLEGSASPAEADADAEVESKSLSLAGPELAPVTAG
ncbi:DUF1275 family protein [Mycobacterium intermedium]|uniref:DUF1275 family protein n=1 Tax=Mycobacterium intermedium TaxID=28445 RepID=A0A1E3S7J2_MYCIE|nr:YoaK family protein [Mycobacterium intermedium]MCV6965079.1 DUF1275 domain-containing protein [Mycobacterium intermedium]ODQ98054.1 hypothetical protein BHQ20_23930 [Mycobacterium intermedium]OPE46247.1 DUF1275 family protein [Mycobacterium intermedium]ORA95018.1 DUF1275 family protein [Mycobacterium intermedium]